MSEFTFGLPPRVFGYFSLVQLGPEQHAVAALAAVSRHRPNVYVAREPVKIIDASQVEPLSHTHSFRPFPNTQPLQPVVLSDCSPCRTPIPSVPFQTLSRFNLSFCRTFRQLFLLSSSPSPSGLAILWSQALNSHLLQSAGLRGHLRHGAQLHRQPDDAD